MNVFGRSISETVLRLCKQPKTSQNRLIPALGWSSRGVRLKITWGVGIVVVVLLSIAAGLLGLVSLRGTISLILLLVGIWTFVAALVLFEREDRAFYLGWGIVIAGLSFTYVIPLADALALILIAIVILILVTVYFGKTPKDLTAATRPQSPAGGTPAATAI